MESLKGKMAGASRPRDISTKLQRAAEKVMQRAHDARSRMRELRTSGSVGGGEE